MSHRRWLMAVFLCVCICSWYDLSVSLIVHEKWMVFLKPNSNCTVYSEQNAPHFDGWEHVCAFWTVRLPVLSLSGSYYVRFRIYWWVNYLSCVIRAVSLFMYVCTQLNVNIKYSNTNMSDCCQWTHHSHEDTSTIGWCRC